MAYVGSKGWYVSELKKLGITKIDGYKLKQYKTYILRKTYLEATSSSN